MGLLFFYVGIALSVSFLCSVLEATLLSVSEVELHDRAHRGEVGARRLLELKDERIGDAISAILTLNTIAHTIGAALAGAQAAKVFGSRWVGLFSAVLTILVLVVTEIIPKTLGTAYASSLVGFVATTLRFLTFVLKPVLAVTGALTRLIAHGEKRPISRGELTSLVSLARREGTLRGEEARVLSNVLSYQTIRVEDVMTPRTVAVTLPAKTTLAEFAASTDEGSFSRIPVWEGDPDQVTGYVRQNDALRELTSGRPPETPLSEIARPIRFVTEETSVAHALREFLEAREHLAMVTNDFGTVVGLLSLEDLLETILGTEILDESDRVADLRQVAVQLRDRRLHRLQEERRLILGEPETQAEEAATSLPVEAPKG